MSPFRIHPLTHEHQVIYQACGYEIVGTDIVKMPGDGGEVEFRFLMNHCKGSQ